MRESTDRALETGTDLENGLGRDFQFYATGRAVSVIGDRVAVIALVFLVIHLSHAFAPALGVFYVCRVLPTLIGGLPAGVIVDQLNRKQLMIAADVGRAILMAAVPAVGALQLWTLYPAVLLLYGLTLMFDNAAQAAVPDVVHAGAMTRANSVLRSIDTAGDLAYALGGSLVFVLGFQAPFYIDGATFLFSALMISRMAIPQQEGSRPLVVSDIVRRVRQGIDYLLANPFLRWSTFTFAVAPLGGGAMFVLVPLYANRVLAHSPGLFGPLGSGAFRFSILEVSLGFGALVGSLVVPRLTGVWPRGRIFGVGVLGTGVVDLLFAGISNMYLAIAGMAVLGLFNTLFVISGLTLVQTLTSTELRGRVLAARMTITNAALAVGSAVGGLLLTSVPDTAMWLILGVTIAASSLFVWLQPAVRGQV